MWTCDCGSPGPPLCCGGGFTIPGRYWPAYMPICCGVITPNGGPCPMPGLIACIGVIGPIPIGCICGPPNPPGGP